MASAQQKEAHGPILGTNITLSWEATTLMPLLKKITNETDLKFSYADKLIDRTEIATGSVKDTTLSYLLDLILDGTSLSYTIVGNIIVLVKTENDVTADTTTSPNHLPEKTIVSRHIEADERVMQQLPWKVRKKLYEHYKQELKLVAASADTTSGVLAKRSGSNIRYNVTNRSAPGYEVSLSVGPSLNLPSVRPVLAKDWARQISFDHYRPVTVQADLQLGYIKNNFIFRTGLSYRSFYFRAQFSDLVEKRDNKGKGRGRDKAEVVQHRFTDRYHIFSLPLMICMTVQKRSFFAEAGTGLATSFIGADNIPRNRFENIYMHHQDDGAHFFEKTNRVLLSGVLDLHAGYSYKHLRLSTGLQYSLAMTPLQKNSYFKLYPNALSFDVRVGISI